MPHRLRLKQRRRGSARRRRERRAVRNRRLRRNGRYNRLYGPARRSTLIERGLPVYLINALLLPPIPPTISRVEFDSSVAHGVERGSDAYRFWLGTQEVVGDIMEYQFRRQFSLPIHIPREAMKLVFLYVAYEDIAEVFGREGWWSETLQVYTFKWSNPFRWPPMT